MDVLDEPLTHEAEGHYAELEVEEEEVMAYRAEVASGEADEYDEEGLDDDPAYGGTLAHEEAVEEEIAVDGTPFVEAEEDAEGLVADTDEAHSGAETGEEHTGDVTIPEGEDDPNATGEEKKRWGWFN
jgi:hypothetical protein